jgi:hypothetical protein
MIKNPDILKRLEGDFIEKQGRLSYGQSLKIFEGLWKEALSLGVLPLKDPLEGIENDIRIARVLNSCLKKSSQE